MSASIILLAFFAFVFYLIISIFVALITLTSIDQSATEFDRSAQLLSHKSGQILDGMSYLDFLFTNQKIVNDVLQNRREITRMINVAPYILGFKNISNVVLCSDNNEYNQSESVAYLSFKNAIPTDKLVDNNSAQYLTGSCEDFFKRIVETSQNYSIDRYSLFQDYDVLVWISPEILSDFISISNFNNTDKSSNSSSNLFTQIILNGWQVENFSIEYVSMTTSIFKTKGVKFKFADQYLSSLLSNSHLSLD
jgi:hypothetical protein